MMVESSSDDDDSGHDFRMWLHVEAIATRPHYNILESHTRRSDLVRGRPGFPHTLYIVWS